jgi:N4-gp56 family major capsid protein
MALTTTTELPDYVQTAFDRLLYFGLRSQPVHDGVATVKPALTTNPGDTVTFQFHNDLSPATTSLNESTDVSRVQMSSTKVDVTLDEYGNAVGLTARLRATGLMDVDAATANVIAWNVLESVDAIARDVLVAGQNVRYAGAKSALTDLTGSDVVTSADIRYVVAKMRGRSAVPSKGQYYVSFIHPDVAHDLRAEAGDSSKFREAHIYASPETIFAGEVGEYEGAVFVETPRAKLYTDGGSGNVDAYATLFVAQEALAKAVAIEPHVVQSPVTDNLRRFPGLGWYGLFGYGRFREAALHRIASASSIGSN